MHSGASRSDEHVRVAGRDGIEQGILEAEDKEACTDSTEMYGQKCFDTYGELKAGNQRVNAPTKHSCSFLLSPLSSRLSIPPTLLLLACRKVVWRLVLLSPSLAASLIRLFFAAPSMSAWLALLGTGRENLGLVAKLRSCL